jgi:hypothetical protein
MKAQTARAAEIRSDGKFVLEGLAVTTISAGYHDLSRFIEKDVPAANKSDTR